MAREKINENSNPPRNMNSLSMPAVRQRRKPAVATNALHVSGIQSLPSLILEYGVDMSVASGMAIVRKHEIAASHVNPARESRSKHTPSTALVGIRSVMDLNSVSAMPMAEKM